MADDKNNTGSPDRDRINLEEDYEIRYWTQALGVSEEQQRQGEDRLRIDDQHDRRGAGYGQRSLDEAERGFARAAQEKPRQKEDSSQFQRRDDVERAVKRRSGVGEVELDPQPFKGDEGEQPAQNSKAFHAHLAPAGGGSRKIINATRHYQFQRAYRTDYLNS